MKMNIYIGKDFDGNPIGVLLSDSIDKVHIAFAGMGETPHSVEKVDPSNIQLGIRGLVFLLTSKEITRQPYEINKEIRYRKWKRGL